LGEKCSDTERIRASVKLRGGGIGGERAFKIAGLLGCAPVLLRDQESCTSKWELQENRMKANNVPRQAKRGSKNVTTSWSRTTERLKGKVARNCRGRGNIVCGGARGVGRSWNGKKNSTKEGWGGGNLGAHIPGKKKQSGKPFQKKVSVPEPRKGKKEKRRACQDKTKNRGTF